ncbi:MAG: PASTA domain-containing protein [Bacteroidetes bacterium]|nr:MAG: PASTA domain-containing protein [Bacteroidota bacterium]
MVEKIWLKIRRVGFELYSFITAPFVMKNCLGLFGFFGGLFLLTFWWLKCYTNHGESVQVPNYVGMGLTEAKQKARSRDFQIIVNDSTYIPGRPPGEVLAQNPEPSSRVKEGRTIYFTVTKNNPDIIKMPNLVGSDDYDLYSRKCSRLGLKPRILSRVADAKLAPNTIVAVLYRGDTITQNIGSGYKVEMGATIDFIISEQVALTVEIPDCICLTLDAARFLITASNLSIGAVIKDGTVFDQETAYVWRQNPKFEPEGQMRVGEQIDLYLTQDIPAGCMEE